MARILLKRQYLLIAVIENFLTKNISSKLMELFATISSTPISLRTSWPYGISDSFRGPISGRVA